MLSLVQEPDNLQLIQKVRFFLHPSFAPNDLIEVTSPPFELRRSGWGEFPVRVQLFLLDAKRNKPVDIIHMLRVRLKPSKRINATCTMLTHTTTSCPP